MMRTTKAVVCAFALTVVGLGPATAASASGCQDNGSELAAIGMFGQNEMTAGEVWGGMASSQHSDFSEVEDGPGVVARHMDLQMEVLCGE